MSNKRLGKGIEALISSYNTESKEGYMDGMIAVSNIVPNPNQPRQNFDPEAMKELINSIREKGIIQPLTVRELNNGRLYPLCSKLFLTVSITGFTASCNIVVINDSSNGDFNSTEIKILALL